MIGSASPPTSSAIPPVATTQPQSKPFAPPGYRGATTTEFGLAGGTEPFTLARVRIDGGDSAGGLARKLELLG